MCKKINYTKPELLINVVEIEDIVLLSSGVLGIIDGTDEGVYDNPTEIF